MKRSPRPHAGGRPDRLVSEAAFDILRLALDAADDPRLSSARLVRVTPARGAGVLSIVLAVPLADLGRLRADGARLVAYLRRELADGLDRKRVPDIALELVPTEDP